MSFEKRRLNPLNQSVIRRSLMLFVGVAPGICLNFAMLFLASKILSIDAFGIFYIAITAVNILFAPAIVLNLICSRYVAQSFDLNGFPGARAAIEWISQMFIFRGGVITAVIILPLYAGATAIGVKSFLIVFLILGIAYTSYVADVGRAALQGLHRTLHLGVYTASWMIFRFIFGLATIYWVGTAWSGLTGILLSGPLVFGLFWWMLQREPTGSRQQIATPDLHILALPSLLRISASFGLLMALSYVDLFVSYIILDPQDIGAYSATALLPKGLLVLTVPIIQMLFPMMAVVGGANAPRSVLVTKGVLATLIASILVAVGVLVASTQLCGGIYGIPACRPSLLLIMLIAAIPFSMLRVLVSTQIARGLEWHPAFLLIPAGIYLVYAINYSETMYEISLHFAVFANSTFVYYSILCLLTKSKGHR